MKLEEIREEIDCIDEEMRKLFVKRMEAAKKVVSVKFEMEEKIFKPEREAQIIEERSREVSNEYIRPYQAFLKKIILISREFQYYIWGVKKSQEKNDSYAQTLCLPYYKFRNSLGTIFSMIEDRGILISEVKIKDPLIIIKLEEGQNETEIRSLMLQWDEEVVRNDL